MSYSIALFLHIVGALGFFVALALEWMGLRHLSRATSIGHIRERLRDATEARRVGMPSMLVVLASGFYMMLIGRMHGAWVIVAFWLLVLVSILAVALSFRRMAAIGRVVAADEGPLSPTLRALLRDPLLWIAIQTRVAIALGIVFLMTIKPGLNGSLLTAALAIALGLGSALPRLNRTRTREEPAT